jgi:hypothetical protein
MGGTYSVYIHTTPSDKKYVGMTGRKPEYRWGKGGKKYCGNEHFWRAIQKYGWDSITHEVVASNLSREEAVEMEIRLIAKYDTTDNTKGYNKSIGGGGAHGLKLTEAQKRHLSEVKKGINPHVWTDEMREKQSESQKGHPGYTKGKHLSKEHRARISKGMKGHKGCDYNRIHYSKPVSQFTLEGEYIQTYYSRKEAARQTGVNISGITQCANGKIKQAGGYVWKEAKGDE